MNKYTKIQYPESVVHVLELEDFTRVHHTKKGFRTVDSIGEELEQIGARVVINGDGWGLASNKMIPNSIAVSDGNLVQSSQFESRPWFKWKENGEFTFGHSKWGWWQLGKYNVISGDRYIMENGQFNEAIEWRNYRDARTCLGVDQTTGKVIIIVGEGNDANLTGLSFLECYEILKNHGATIAINLDGGSNSALWLEGSLRTTSSFPYGYKAIPSHLVFWYEAPIGSTPDPDPDPEPEPGVIEWPDKIVAVVGNETRDYVFPGS